MAKKAGRPSTYSPAVAQAICLRMIDGESLRSICRDEAMPAKSSVFLWLELHADFRTKYTRACELRADHLFDEMLEIADDNRHDTKIVGRDGAEYDVADSEWISRSKLRVETRKWQASKLAPKKYGDKQVIEHTDPSGGNPFASLLEAVGAGGRPRPPGDVYLQDSGERVEVTYTPARDTDGS